MNYPTFDQYQATIQSPKTCFTIKELQNGTIEKDLWGLPRVRSGGFALTYKVCGRNRCMAVRCFHKDVEDRSRRYIYISKFIKEINSSYLTPITYIHKGIRINGKIYPITNMDWIEGVTLEKYINVNINDPAKYFLIAQKFKQLIQSMSDINMAHGDLSQQNIMVNGSELILVDYDGMYIQEFKGKPSNEIGHVNFQHPKRDYLWFNLFMDRFSSIVIYLALTGLAINPDLWKRYESSGEGLLFRKQDFLHPYQSPLLQELETCASLRETVYLFRKICLSPIENVPSIGDFLSGHNINLPTDEIQVNFDFRKDHNIAFDSGRRLLLMNNLGKIVTVVGKVTEVFSGKTQDGKHHLFLNFGNWKGRCFTVVLWGDAYIEINEQKMDINIFLNKWISSTGIITSYKHRPQIALSSLLGFEVLTSEAEAKNRLGATQENPDLVNLEGKPDATISPILYEKEGIIYDPIPAEIELDENMPCKITNKENIRINDKNIREYQLKIQKRIDELYSKLPGPKNK
jgi:hypothetical protein